MTQAKSDKILKKMDKRASALRENLRRRKEKSRAASAETADTKFIAKEGRKAL